MHNLFNKSKKASNLQKSSPLLILIAIIILGFFVFSLIKAPSESFNFIFQGNSLKSTDGRVNILLLGNGGGTHDGADLTDTIMVASINLKTNNVYLISLPRDLWIDSVKGKVNSLYEIGKAKDQGLPYSKQILGDILGIPVHYAVRVDFGGFVKAVDLMGGIDINVENTFTDYLYPIEGRENDLCGMEEKEIDFNEEEAKKLNIPVGKRRVLVDKTGKIATDSAEPDQGYRYFICRYETISFKEGETHMDGITALKFVRSRHALGKEGTDFARSRRQQLILDSFRKKVLSLDTLSSPSKVTALIQTFGDSFETDVPAKDILDFINLAKKIDQTFNLVLGPPLLTNPPLADFGGAWVLIPKGNNFDEVHEYIEKTLKGEGQDASSSARPSN